MSFDLEKAMKNGGKCKVVFRERLENSRDAQICHTGMPGKNALLVVVENTDVYFFSPDGQTWGDVQRLHNVSETFDVWITLYKNAKGVLHGITDTSLPQHKETISNLNKAVHTVVSVLNTTMTEDCYAGHRTPVGIIEKGLS